MRNGRRFRCGRAAEDIANNNRYTCINQTINHATPGTRLMNVKRLPLRRKLLYSLIVCLGFFGFLELALRVLKVGNPPVLGQLRFGYDTGIPLFDSDGIEQEGVVHQDVPLFERHPSSSGNRSPIRLLQAREV